MFRPVRRTKNEIPAEEAKQLLHDERRGVLALHGDDGYPYAVPVNYFYDEAAQKIYFHGAKAGHKVDALEACDKVCFTVYGHETIKTDAWAPYLQSTVVFGRCRIMADHEEAMKQLKRMAMKYYPDEALVDSEIRRAEKTVQMFEITIEHLTGKEVQER